MHFLIHALKVLTCSRYSSLTSDLLKLCGETKTKNKVFSEFFGDPHLLLQKTPDIIFLFFSSIILRLAEGPPLRWSCSTPAAILPLTQPQISLVRCFSSLKHQMGVEIWTSHQSGTTQPSPLAFPLKWAACKSRPSTLFFKFLFLLLSSVVCRFINCLLARATHPDYESFDVKA